ncbi:hypothetical protein [Mesorhizobium captivum]|uniref:hypothetical protein n=1 Tax=Mesorhizobium captivum TaxID=3072319 RepID=UPI002A242500|nr:hypothetical protein [Mesorhizobium sp. VK3C]MDX8450389.1 hypothetical protein [Mesorhizobium sp. VK3C]
MEMLPAIAIYRARHFFFRATRCPKNAPLITNFGAVLKQMETMQIVMYFTDVTVVLPQNKI